MHLLVDLNLCIPGLWASSGLKQRGFFVAETSFFSFHHFVPSRSVGMPSRAQLMQPGSSSEPGFGWRLWAENVIPGWHLCSLDSWGHRVSSRKGWENEPHCLPGDNVCTVWKSAGDLAQQNCSVHTHVVQGALGTASTSLCLPGFWWAQHSGRVSCDI